MGLMYARKQAAKKQIEANKQRAHAENHKAAWKKHGKPGETIEVKTEIDEVVDLPQPKKQK